VARRFRQ
jgi:hypothetical protein